MNQDEFKKEVKRLADMAREIQRKITECGDDHNYRVNSFSKIIHPFGFLSRMPSEDIVFSSYTCTRCGQTLSPSEMKEYRKSMREKITAKADREQIIEEYKELCGYGTDEDKE